MSKRKGFIIANEHEEFVAGFKEDNGFQVVGWTPLLSFAMVFRTRKHCRKSIMSIATGKYSLWEMELYETKDRLILGCDCEVLPPWFTS